MLWGFAVSLWATTIPVTNSTYSSLYTSAVDGDTLLMASGTYATSIVFPTSKTITFKAATDAIVKITFSVTGTTSATGGGLIFDRVRISPSSDYFINADIGNMNILAFRNDTIATVNRCILRTNTAGYTIKNIEVTNCIISNCGANGYNLFYPKHIIKNFTVKNCTMYSYTNGESFFYANSTASTTDTLNFTFINNTVYKWAKSTDRALCNAMAKYSTASNYIFKNNIIAEPGVSGTLPKPLVATGGNLIALNNLIVDYGTYNQTSAVSQSISDLTLSGLGLSSLSFPDPDNGDFTTLKTSVLATAGSDGGPVGDPRWYKSFINPEVLTTSVTPAAGGSVTPLSATYEKDSTVTVTATYNYGYRFKEWQDGNGNTISSSNPFSFKITKDTSLVAVFTALEMHTLTVKYAGDGASWGDVSLNPEETDNSYEVGTIVDVSVVSNGATSFLYWDNGSTSTSRQIQMNKDTAITATFDVIPFIVGWDFVTSSPTSNRTGDYYSVSSNTGYFQIFTYEGTSTSWGASSKTFGGETYSCARRYTDASIITTAPRYFQAKFSGTGYTSIKVKSKIAVDNVCVHTKQLMQYSTDGTNFINIDTVDISSGYNSEWMDCNATLPELTESEKSTIYVRWIPDINSSLYGTPASTATEGFYLANVFVYAVAESVKDTVAPILVSTVPTEGSSTASASGSIVFSFNEKVQLKSGTFSLNGEELTPVFGSKTATFSYSGLDYGTKYSFIIPAGTIEDVSGNLFKGDTLIFTTMERPDPIARVYNAVVDAYGTGDYTTIQAAVDAAPTSRTSPWLIFVKNGTYKELVRIPATKPYLYFIGQDKTKVKICFAINCASSSSDTGWDYSYTNYNTTDGCVVVANATNFYAENISFINTYGVNFQSGPMALAMKSKADRFAFYNCNFRSYQDTWYTAVSNVSDRQYAFKCYIEGAVDYIYGGGDCFFDKCNIYSVRSGAVIVAPSHGTGTKYGYVFNSCTLNGNSAAGDGNLKLGRPWQNSPIAVYLNTTMNVVPAPEGWTNMGVIPKLFAEYNSMDANGNAIDLSNRKSSYTTSGGVTQTGLQTELSQTEAAAYTYENVIEGSDQWNPRAYFEPVSAPSNLSVSSTTLSWTASKYTICYVVFRDTSVIGFTTSTNYTDATAAVGKTYSYYVKAANEYGSISASSDTVTVKITTTDVKAVNSETLQVYTYNSTLYINNIISGSEVTIYSVSGNIVFKQKVNSTTFVKEFPELNGIYLVKVGSSVYKVKF